MVTIRVTADDGHVLSAESQGHGTTVLVVPPGGSDASSWAAVAGCLAARFRVVTMQRRIYEPDAVIALPHTMALEAADIVAVARALPGPVMSVGHSSGGVALLEAAVVRPELFGLVVLYEPPVPTSTLVGGMHNAEARRALDAGDASGAMRIHLRDIVGIPAEIVTQMWADPQLVHVMTRYAAGQLADNEAIDALGIGVGRYRSVGVPVALIEGEQSPPHLRRRVAELAAALPDVTGHRVLVGQGHVANLGAPGVLADTVAELIEDILDRT